jgi:membrane protein DedA with SNARE-associated domain
MERHVLDLFARHGSLVLFFAQVFGIFGLPIPDELLLTIAGSLVRKGDLDAGRAAFATISGCMAGITLSYVVGRTVAVATLRRVIHLSADNLQRGRRWFRRFGPWLLAFGYFVPGVRHVTAIAAGTAPLEFGRFALCAYSGAVLWCGVFLGAGYLAGDRWSEILTVIRHHSTTGAIVLFGIVAAYVALVRARDMLRERGRRVRG